MTAGVHRESVGKRPTPRSPLKSETNTEQMEIRIRNKRTVKLVWTRILAVKVAGAHKIILGKLAGGTELIHETRFVVSYKNLGSKRCVFKDDLFDDTPISPIKIKLEVPIWGLGEKKFAEHILRKID